MRRSRRGHKGGHEFGGSGEDSFVAVVVTKLTGALLFILLLTMVIMALIPKADEEMAKKAGDPHPPASLAIKTPEALPEAIAGRPYTVALAAEGGSGARSWALDGALPDGLTFDSGSGVIAGVPKKGTSTPIDLVVRVKDESSRAASRARLLVYESDAPLSTPSRWKPGLPPVPWRAWMEQGFGFLVLLMVHLVGMNAVAAMERISSDDDASGRSRFFWYRMILRVATTTAMAGLAVWLWRARSGSA